MAWRQKLSSRYPSAARRKTPKVAQRPVEKPPSPGLIAIQAALLANIQRDGSEHVTHDEEFDAICSRLATNLPEFESRVLPVTDSSERWLEVSRKVYDIAPPLSLLPKKSARVLLSSAGHLAFEALGRLGSKETVCPDRWRERLFESVKWLHPDSRFCIGLSAADVEGVSRLSPSPTWLLNECQPFDCHRSSKCQVWLRQGTSRRCEKCTLALRHLREALAKRRDPLLGKKSPFCNLRYLSPGSRAKRLRLARKRLLYKIRKSATGPATDLLLSESQNSQMEQIASLLKSDYSAEVEAVLAEAGEKCTADFEAQCRSAWQRDQSRNVDGGRGNRWSLITYRLALAVYARSPAAYRQLKAFPVIQLPSERQLKRALSCSFGHGQGTSQEYLQMAAEHVRAQQKGDKPSKMAGLLIFDETKVVGKICWNSKNQEIYGVASSSDGLKSLVDVYQETEASAGSKTGEYALQFLWRDLTSNCDILGPYWLFPKTVTASFLWSCLYEALRNFYAFGFKIEALVCDGASYNLSLVKRLCSDHQGSFGVGRVNPIADDQYSVPCSFANPFDVGKQIFVVPCPSHLLKNCVNALHASSPSRAKSLRWEAAGPVFGWKVAEDLWKREVERRARRSQLVPGLQQSHIVRDAWTKLNVAPAKIMQSEEVLAELQAQVACMPSDWESVKAAANYLGALNCLFENGFLSHKQVSNLNSDPVASICTGLDALCLWHHRLSTGLGDFAPSSPRESRFLGWQTFDLLRLAVCGFRGLVGQFERCYPGYYIVPHRVNGSAVETIFSQVRQRTSGPTTSINYGHGVNRLKATAHCDYRGKRKPNADSYRDSQIDLPVIVKQRKK